MDRSFFAQLCVFLSLFHLCFGTLGGLWFNNPATKLVETQLQNALREQQILATGLIRSGVQQATLNSNRLQATQFLQSAAANALSAKGLFDLNNIGRLILSSDTRQCYQQNRFTFGDAIDTAKNQAFQCLSDKLNEGRNIIENARNNIQSAFYNFGNGVQLISDCGQITMTYPSPAGIVAKTACLNQAVINIRSSTIVLPINIAKRILEATESITTIESDIAKCNLKIVEAISAEAIKAGEAIVECIDEKNGITTTIQTSTTDVATTTTVSTTTTPTSGTT